MAAPGANIHSRDRVEATEAIGEMSAEHRRDNVAATVRADGHCAH
jgi:hypothetical protein